MSVVIETTIGDITVDLLIKERPTTCKNFLKLCKTKYYNLNLFHSIQRGFIAQTGDPSGTGRGGDSVFGILYGDQARYYEGEKIPRVKHIQMGTLSMVNCGDNLFGSQFFLTLGPSLDYLDEEHCVFGHIVEGFEILDKLNETICDEEHRPYQDIRITHTVILEDPFDDPNGLRIPDRSPSPSKEMLDSGRIGADEDIDDTKGKSLEELEEIIQDKEAKARATILEMVGDLPDADIAPPENVLFVCKLNPVTADEDLEIIFSRFGRIKNCEVIRDKTSGESLQNAFVEFEDQKACEDAYFKMDNVLIDDRRIHVDFSQSVSQYKWKGKGRGVEVFEDKKNDNPIKKQPPPWIKSDSGRYFNQPSKSTSSSFSNRNSKPDYQKPTSSSSYRDRKDSDYDRRDHRSDYRGREDRRDRDRNTDRRDSRDYKRDKSFSDRRDRDKQSDRRDESRNVDKRDKYRERDEERRERARRVRSKTPPKYSRAHSSEQKRDKGDSSIDEKLLKLLKQSEVLSKKSKKKKSKKGSKRDDSSDESSSDSDSSYEKSKSKRHKR